MSMQAFKLSSVALMLGLGLALDSNQLVAHDRDRPAEEANRQLVIQFYQGFFHRHQMTAARVLSDGYKQHNPLLADGKAAFLGYFQQHFKQYPQADAQIVRSAADGDLVYLHVHSRTSPSERGEAIVDIFRVKGQQIVEHWDVIQAIPAQAANANSMF